LNLSLAAQKILEHMPINEKISYIVASPDLWNRRQETGESGFEIMAKAGLSGLIPANNARVPGWRTLTEYLHPYEDEQSTPDNIIKRSKITIFDNCSELIRCLPQLQHDKNNVEDVAKEPHEITHNTDSLRYGVMSRPQAGQEPKEKTRRFWGFSPDERENGEITDAISDNYINYGVE
jgi:phage terminase large subunit